MRRTSILGALYTVMMVGILASVSATTTNRTLAEKMQSSSEDLHHAREFRQSSGLRADSAFVLATYSDDAYSSEEWGIPFSKQELSILGNRMRIQQSISDVKTFAAKQDGYAGVYFDDDVTGTPVFLFTQAADLPSVERMSRPAWNFGEALRAG